MGYGLGFGLAWVFGVSGLMVSIQFYTFLLGFWAFFCDVWVFSRCNWVYFGLGWVLGWVGGTSGSMLSILFHSMGFCRGF